MALASNPASLDARGARGAGSATRRAVSVLGIVVALAGIEHGIGEMLQGNIAPNGIAIQSWPDSDAFRTLGGEPAMTIVPNLLITGVLVAQFAQVYQPESERPIILNYLAYPDRAALSAQERERLRAVVAIYDGVRIEDRGDGLDYARGEMTRASDARICLSGRLTGFEGRIPGVLQEVFMSLRSERPVYLSAMMGGATELLVRYVHGEHGVFSSSRRGTGARGGHMDPERALRGRSGVVRSARSQWCG